MVSLTRFDVFLKVPGTQRFPCASQLSLKKAEEKREKLKFLTLEKSLKMFLVCTLMDQKAEGKEKKRSLKMP